MEDFIKAHEYSSNHMLELIQDEVCGCFYCLKIFNPSEIVDWIPDKRGTAVCPYCGVDSVIGESSGYKVTEDLLRRMHEYWF